MQKQEQHLAGGCHEKQGRRELGDNVGGTSQMHSGTYLGSRAPRHTCGA